MHLQIIYNVSHIHNEIPYKPYCLKKSDYFCKHNNLYKLVNKFSLLITTFSIYEDYFHEN